MEEIDLAAKLQKISKMDPRALGAKSVVEMATIRRRQAVHLEKEIGSLEPGKKADLILINLAEPNAVPMYDVYSQLAYALKASDVDTVIIGGRVRYARPQASHPPRTRNPRQSARIREARRRVLEH